MKSNLSFHFLFFLLFFLFNSLQCLAISQQLSTVVHQPASAGLSWDFCSEQLPCNPNYTCECDTEACRCLPKDAPPFCPVGDEDCAEGEKCQRETCVSLTSDLFKDEQTPSATNSQSHQPASEPVSAPPVVTSSPPKNTNQGPEKQQETNKPSNTNSGTQLNEDQTIETTEAEEIPFASGEAQFDSDPQVTDQESTSKQTGPVTVDNIVPTASVSPIPRINEQNSQSNIPTPEVGTETNEEFPLPEITEAIITSSEEASDVCIDKQLLEHLSSEEMVFDTHRNGKVLCDNNSSCATPGHIVEWNGKAMMMSNYCNLFVNGGCIGKNMLVNSPRYKKALKVNTYTKGLTFTVFAARYETKTEEKLLTTMVRIGL